MNEKVKTILTMVAYGVLVWGLISNSIARVIGSVGILFLIGLDNSK